MDEPKMNIRPAVIVNILSLIAALALSVSAYVQLPPDTLVPTHWGVNGQPDAYMPKAIGLFLGAIALLAILITFAALTFIEPRQPNLRRSGKAFTTIWIMMSLFMLSVHAIAVLASLGYKLQIPQLVPAGMGVIFIVIGNYMGKMRSNFTMGIRTPWTLSSELSWRKSHRLGGKLFVLLGVVIILSSFMASDELKFAIMMGGLLSVAIFLIVYSYFVWKSDPDRNKV